MIIEKRTESRLIRRAKAGDGNAIEALIQAHQEALYAFMLRMSGRPDVAEDITQEAFVRVLRNIDRFDSRFRFSTWLFTIAKRLYVNSVQKLAPRYDTEMVVGRNSGGDAPGHHSARTESIDHLRGALEAALDDLNTQQREIVLLFHQQSWSITAISEHLEMPEGTVKSHLHRARKRMRQYITADAKMHDQCAEVWT